MPQLEDEDALDMDKFTIIAVEAPGWGRSCPPARKYGAYVYDNDAECFYEMMQVTILSNVKSTHTICLSNICFNLSLILINDFHSNWVTNASQ